MIDNIPFAIAVKKNMASTYANATILLSKHTINITNKCTHNLVKNLQKEISSANQIFSTQNTPIILESPIIYI